MGPAAPSTRPSRDRPRTPADPARRVAFDALRAVHADDAYANLVLPRLLGERRISGRDAAFATELLHGTCRLEGTYDLIIAAAAGRRLTTLQPAVVDLLRLGAHQLLSMRVPTHAAVDASVELATRAVGRRVSGLVNAVLRKVAAQDWDGWTAQLSRGLEPHAALAVTTAHPQWVVDAFADVVPEAELEPALRADNEPAPVSLAVRPGLATVEELVAAGAEPGRYSPFAASWSGNPGELAAVRDGRAGVQDEGSQLVSLALTRAETWAAGPWLDLCAGPGGKSALLAGLAAEAGTRLLSVEPAAHRAALVAAARRAYPGAPGVVIADGRRPAWRPGSFARVLADVPCSGLGALRRRPESRWRRSPEVVEELHPLQVELLTTALNATAPGGVVAYVTCSPHRRETEDVVGAVVDAAPGVSVLDAPALLPEVSEARRGSFVQLWPHRHGTDAMFLALLRPDGGR